MWVSAAHFIEFVAITRNHFWEINNKTLIVLKLIFDLLLARLKLRSCPSLTWDAAVKERTFTKVYKSWRGDC